MTILVFGIGFAAVCLLSLFWPVVGVFAYVANYVIAPDRQWWGEPYAQFGVRFSWTLALCIALGTIARWTRLRSYAPGKLLHSQEILVWAFAAVIVLSRLWGEPIDMTARSLAGRSETPMEKIPKVAVFIFLMTHVLVRYRAVRWMPWVLVLVGGLYLGLDAYTAGESRYVKGRLDGLGGADFRESSAVGAHLAAMSALAGVLYLKSRTWWAKALCVVAGGFSINAIILTQTRAALVAICAGGLLAPVLAPPGRRGRVCVYVALGCVAAGWLTNDVFWSRASTLTVSVDELDPSAASRLDLWQAGLAMWRDNPLGVGAGSFYSVIGRYNPAYAGRDCHNTYIRCAAELGLPGAVLLAALVINAFRILQRVPSQAAGTPIEQEIAWDCYGFQLVLVVYLVAGMFMGLTYIEEMWWLLAIPVCLERAAIHGLGDWRECDREAPCAMAAGA